MFGPLFDALLGELGELFVPHLGLDGLVVERGHNVLVLLSRSKLLDLLILLPPAVKLLLRGNFNLQSKYFVISRKGV